MNHEVVKRLAAEVLELFDAGGVGLYEFVWSLRSVEPDVAEADYEKYARAALDLLLRHNAVKLVSRKWAMSGSEVDVEAANVDWPTAWLEPTDEPYLEVESTQDRKSRIALMMELDPPNRG